MRSINLVYAFVICSIFKTAFAGPCSPVGNRAEGLPIYDQGSSNICYAHTAAQMFDTWRKRSGEKVPPLSSASELAFRYTSRDPSAKNWKDVQGGNTFKTINMVFSEGSCPYYDEKDFRMDTFGGRWDEFEKLNKLRREYFKLEEKIQQGKRVGFFSRQDPREKQQELIHEFACDFVQDDKLQNEINSISQLLKKALDTGTTMNFFQKYYEKGCQKLGRLSKQANLKSWTIADVDKVNENIQDLKKRLNSSLETGKGAPGIVYCSNILKNPGSSGPIEKNYVKDCSLGDAHASIVVDRRPGKNGACEYLVRNTWGTSCNGYVWECHKGQIWLPENELLKNTISVLWVE